MDFNDIPGLELLAEALRKLKSQYSSDELQLRSIRSAAVGSKAALDQLQIEFPEASVKKLVSDVYTTVTSQEVAVGISTFVQSFDEEKARDALESIVAALQDEETSQKVAKSLKEALAKVPLDDIADQVEAQFGDRNPSEAAMFSAFFDTIKSQLEEIRDGTIEEGGEKIRELASIIPVDAIAEKIGSLTAAVTPEFVSGVTHNVVGKLPSPNAVAGILHGVAKGLSAQFNEAAQAKTLDEAKAALAGIPVVAQDVVLEKLAEDKIAKKSFGKKKGGSDLSL